MNEVSLAVNPETPSPPPVVRQTIERLLREGRKSPDEIWKELSRIARIVQVAAQELGGHN